MSNLFLLMRNLFFVIALLFFVANCNDDDSVNEPTQLVTVEGTLTLPTEAAGKLYGVLIDTDFDGDNGSNYMGTGVCGAGTEVIYSVKEVAVGTYYLYAVVFVVSELTGGPGTGDFIGIYGGTLTNPPITPNAEITSSGTVSFDITLSVMP